MDAFLSGWICANCGTSGAVIVIAWIMHLPDGQWQQVTSSRVEYRPGVYAVRIVNRRRKPWRINRFLERDSDGILCLGQSSSLENRRRAFINAVRKRVKHSEGNLLNIISMHADGRSAFGDREALLSLLEWRFEYMNEPDGARQREDILIKHYVLQFGEPPPLNSASQTVTMQAPGHGLRATDDGPELVGYCASTKR